MIVKYFLNDEEIKLPEVEEELTLEIMFKNKLEQDYFNTLDDEASKLILKHLKEFDND
jgi:hypothetical protein